jgi:hypothetical protein
MRFLDKMIFCILLCLNIGCYADWGVDSHWNDPGVTVRQPNVWSNPNVMVTDTLGRPVPSSSSICQISRICYPNGNCVLQKICK